MAVTTASEDHGPVSGTPARDAAGGARQAISPAQRADEVGPAKAPLQPAAAPEGIARLLHKYDTLAALRAARARGEPIPEKAVFKTLAAELPGALHELDRLSLPEIDARREALRAALSGGDVAPWMTAMAAYHALYRAALFVKVRTAKGAVPDTESAARLAEAASRHAATEVDAAFVKAVARPPGGRIGAVVLAAVAARAGGDERAIQQAIFPTRRDFAPGPGAPPPGDVQHEDEDG